MDNGLPIPVVSNVAHIIQLALAPVFLLTGVSGFLNVCTGRLARIVDRARMLEPLILSATGGEHDRLVGELRILDRRMRIVDSAIMMSVVSACLICIVVVVLFAAEVAGRGFGRTIALLFIASMLCMGGAFAIFILEIRLASRAIRISEELLLHKADETA